MICWKSKKVRNIFILFLPEIFHEACLTRYILVIKNVLIPNRMWNLLYHRLTTFITENELDKCFCLRDTLNSTFLQLLYYFYVPPEPTLASRTMVDQKKRNKIGVVYLLVRKSLAAKTLLQTTSTNTGKCSKMVSELRFCASHTRSLCIFQKKIGPKTTFFWNLTNQLWISLSPMLKKLCDSNLLGNN